MLFGFEESAAERPEATPADPEPAIDPSETSTPKRAGWARALGALLIGILVGAVAVLLWPDTEELTIADVDEAVAAALSNQPEEQSPAARAFDSVVASLVTIEATGSSTDDSLLGSGVVINERGEVMTSLHVVADAAEITVQFATGERSQAEVLSSDPSHDIAILAVSATTASPPAVVIGNSRTLRVGDPVFAVGHPLGLAGSVTAGVISGLGRTIGNPDGSDDLAGQLDDLIQFDAAVNRGSSGGPLLNADGQVIGIVTALADPTGEGSFTGIGFAVPIDIAASQAADGPSQ